jgi:hypothetical protein
MEKTTSTRDPLHGMTVVVQVGDKVHVGKCHKLTRDVVLLQNGDVHSEGQDGLSIDDYLQRTAKFGVWGKHDQIILPTADVSSIKPLREYYGQAGQAAGESVDTTLPDMGESPAGADRTDVENTDRPVQVTDVAAAEIRRLIDLENRTDEGLRLAVTGGGCSGMVYKVEFDKSRENDVVPSRPSTC